jgi:hypothetical protein
VVLSFQLSANGRVTDTRLRRSICGFKAETRTEVSVFFLNELNELNKLNKLYELPTWNSSSGSISTSGIGSNFDSSNGGL